MAADPFTIYTSQLVNASGIITDNGKFVLNTSDEFNNNGGYDSIIVNVDFSDLTPDPETTSPGYFIRAELQTSDNEGNWFPIGHMFEPVRRPEQGLKHIIVIQPNTFNINEGFPTDIFDGQNVVSRISRQQGALGVDFRTVVSAIETKQGTANALESFKLSIYGERYNHA